MLCEVVRSPHKAYKHRRKPKPGEACLAVFEPFSEKSRRNPLQLSCLQMGLKMLVGFLVRPGKQKKTKRSEAEEGASALQYSS